MPHRLIQPRWWASQSFWVLYPPFALIVLGYMVLCGAASTEPVSRIEEYVVTPIVRHGEKMKVRYVFDRIRTCAVTRQATIRDGAGELHDLPLESAVAVGEPGHEDTVRGYPIERDFAPGPSTMRLVLGYTCPVRIGFGLTLPNLFQEVAPLVVIYGDYPFTIVTEPATRKVR